MNRARWIACLALVAGLSLPVFSTTFPVPLRVLRDGSASTTTWTGSDKELMVSGASHPTFGWLEFQPDTTAKASESVRLDLFIRTVTQSGTLRVFALSSPILSGENGVQVRDLSVMDSTPLASILLVSGTNERLVSIDLTPSKARLTNGILLTSDDGLFVKIAAKESGVPAQLVMLETVLDSTMVGPAGPQGPEGPQGLDGAVGPKGDPGARGATGPVGPQGLKGDVGATGATGPQGLTGSVGAPGMVGAKGDSGARGPKGDSGAPGVAGPVGPQGPMGLTGAVGAAGAKGEVGAMGPTGPQGLKGDVGATGATGAKGEVGATGATGPQGLTGSVGATGMVGAKGDSGARGPKGDSGAPGVAGPVGPQGPMGLTGAVGPTGATGAKGDIGATGPIGPQGLKGDVGATGATGATGAKGEVGAIGPIGPQGLKGATGATGPQGLTGSVGSPGPMGPQGVAGEVGAAGPAGAKGDAGDPGFRHVVVVAATGTALANGDSLLAVLARIADASVSNPYVLKLEPGVFDLGTRALLPKPNVDLVGSGASRTSLRSARDGSYDSSGVIWVQNLGSESPRIANLAVANNGSGTCIGISATHSDLSLDNVTVQFGSMLPLVGVQVLGSNSVKVANSTVKLESGTVVYGLLVDASQMELRDLDIRVLHAGQYGAALVTRNGSNQTQEAFIEGSRFSTTGWGSASGAAWSAAGSTNASISVRVLASKFNAIDSGTSGVLSGLSTATAGIAMASGINRIDADASEFTGKQADIFADGIPWLVRIGASKIGTGTVLTDRFGAVKVVRSYTGSYDPTNDRLIQSTLDQDTSNCGGLGNHCPAGINAQPACGARSCAFSCNSNFGDCDANHSNGCETDLIRDVNNCGGCGVKCGEGMVPVPNATPVCIGGCRIGSCNPGFGDCNNSPDDGCEVSLNTNSSHCGACGMACSPNNLSPSCGAGQCNGACNIGFADCNNNKRSDGCETNTKNDPNNCGACGRVCPAVANGSRTCSNGVCGIGSCSAGFGNCNQVNADGCEIALISDPNNCGTCGGLCPMVANGNRQCLSGACGIGSCNAGFADCNAMGADGCETNLLSNSTNCGACGAKCPTGKTCQVGQCK